MWLGVWCLAPLSTIYQLYNGDGKKGGGGELPKRYNFAIRNTLHSMALQKLIRIKPYISMKNDFTVCVRLFHHQQYKIVLVIQRVSTLWVLTSRLQSNHNSTRYHKHGLLDFYAIFFLYDPFETQISNFLRYI